MPATPSPTLPEPSSPAAFNFAALLLLAVSSLSLLVTDHFGLVSAGHFLGGGLLVCLLFFIPDLLAGRRGARWWESPAVWTIIVLVLAALVGSLLGRWSTAVYLGVVLLLPWVLRRKGAARRPSGWLSLTVGFGLVGLCGFVYLSLYGRGYHSWVFTESAVVGGGVLDTYFHASVYQY